MDGNHEVQLHLHNADGYPVQLYGQTDRQQSYVIRVQQQNDVDSNTQINGLGNVFLKVLDGYECLESAGESSTETLTTNNFFMFSTRMRNLPELVLCISIHKSPIESPEPPPIGTGYVMAAQLNKSIGQLTVTLVNKKVLPVGHINVDYVVIKPWEPPVLSGPKQEISSHPPTEEHQGASLCGHRGAGASFDTANPSLYPENTIAAFRAAKSLGLQFIEFDVHVTKDHVPVIFHDDTVKLCVQTNHPQKGTTPGATIEYEIAVKDLTLKQTREVKVWERSDAIADRIMAAGEKIHQNDIILNGMLPSPDSIQSRHDKSIFPSLEEVFLEVPQETGFFIEVKYPMETVGSGSVEHLCSDANVLVDAILNVVYQEAMSRKLFLICFDPNICTMLKLKQSRFPVLFLSSGENDFWAPYKDMRSKTLSDAVAFAKSHDLDGVSLFSTPLLRAPQLIDRVLEAGLVLSTWGEENCEATKRQWQQERGIKYITVDRL